MRVVNNFLQNIIEVKSEKSEGLDFSEKECHKNSCFALQMYSNSHTAGSQWRARVSNTDVSELINSMEYCALNLKYMK